MTHGVAGTGERLAFLFDSRTVRLSGLAGELVLPPKKEEPVLHFARTPFTCGFVAGDKQLELCTVQHLPAKVDGTEELLPEPRSASAKTVTNRWFGPGALIECDADSPARRP